MLDPVLVSVSVTRVVAATEARFESMDWRPSIGVAAPLVELKDAKLTFCMLDKLDPAICMVPVCDDKTGVVTVSASIWTLEMVDALTLIGRPPTALSETISMSDALLSDVAFISMGAPVLELTSVPTVSVATPAVVATMSATSSV